MASTIRIAPFAAKFILNYADGSRTFHPCEVVGVSNTSSGPWFIARVNYENGVIRAEELYEVFDPDAEMPAR